MNRSYLFSRKSIRTTQLIPRTFLIFVDVDNICQHFKVTLTLLVVTDIIHITLSYGRQQHHNVTFKYIFKRHFSTNYTANYAKLYEKYVQNS